MIPVTILAVALSWSEDEQMMRPAPLFTLAELLPPRPAWMAAAACRDRPDVTWFPEKGQSTAPAKAICSECPSKVPCLAFALETEADGVWGGTSVKERRAAQRRAS